PPAAFPSPGRPCRRRRARVTSSALITSPAEPVQEITKSAAARRPGMSSRSAVVPETAAASRRARSGVRFATTMRNAPIRAAVLAASELIEPAPITRTARPPSGTAGSTGAGRCSAASPIPTPTTLAPARAMPVSACAPLAQREGSQVAEDAAKGALLTREAQRLADLAEDLALTHHQRLQPACHREQVLHGTVLVVHVKVRGEFAGREPGVPGQQFGDRGNAAVELVHLGVDLDPVAG